MGRARRWLRLNLEQASGAAGADDPLGLAPSKREHITFFELKRSHDCAIRQGAIDPASTTRRRSSREYAAIFIDGQIIEKSIADGVELLDSTGFVDAKQSTAAFLFDRAGRRWSGSSRWWGWLYAGAVPLRAR